MYTEQEREEIESVLAVFRDYIEGDDSCDLAYSKRVGYLYGMRMTDYKPEYDYYHIFTVDDLLEHIQGQMYADAMDKYDTMESYEAHGGYVAVMEMANKEANERLNRILKEHNLPFEYSSKRHSY